MSINYDLQKKTVNCLVIRCMNVLEKKAFIALLASDLWLTVISPVAKCSLKLG